MLKKNLFSSFKMWNIRNCRLVALVTLMVFSHTFICLYTMIKLYYVHLPDTSCEIYIEHRLYQRALHMHVVTVSPLSFSFDGSKEKKGETVSYVYIYTWIRSICEFMRWCHRGRVHIVTLSLNFRSPYLSFRFTRRRRRLATSKSLLRDITKSL